MLTRIAEELPKFPIDETALEILQTPTEFKQNLLQGIQSAKRRIVLSSLYLGSSEDWLVRALMDQLDKCKDLQVIIMLDYFRGMRIEKGTSSFKMLQPLTKYSDRVCLGFYHSPSVGTLTKAVVPPRFIEGFGLQHIKCYIFDDELIMSGANLSKDYFENRQDRYMKIKSSELCDYFYELMDRVSRFVFKLQGSELTAPIGWKSRDYHSRFQKELHDFISDQTRLLKLRSGSTFISPAIQLQPLGINQDKRVFMKLLSMLPERPELEFKLATAYFNLPILYQELLFKANLNQISVLTSAPQANGFFESKGVSRYVPSAYSYLELEFLNKAVSHSHPNILHEYLRNGWTWHGKGAWCFDREYCLTAIGSSNFNYRSLDRDFEAQLYIFTNNDNLKQRIKSNLDSLYQYSRIVKIEELSQRPLSLTLKAATRIIKSML